MTIIFEINFNFWFLTTKDILEYFMKIKSWNTYQHKNVNFFFQLIYLK